MKEWDFEDLDRPTQMAIEDITTAFVKNNKNTQEVQDDFQDVITELNDEGYNVDEKGMSIYFRNRADNEKIRAEVYDAEKGIIRHFSEGRELMRVKYLGRSVDDIRESIRHEIVVPTQLAIESAAEIVTQLEHFLKNPQEETGKYAFEKPFEQKDFDLFHSMIALLDDDNDESIEVWDTNFITQTAKALSNFDMVSSSERKAFYDYWEQKNALYKTFARTVFGLEGVAKDIESVKISQSLLDELMASDMMAEKDKEKLEDAEILTTVQQFRKDIKDIVIPNYLIEFRSISMKQLKDDSLVTELVRKYLKTIGAPLPSSIRVAERAKADDDKVVHPQLAEDKQQTQQERTSIPAAGEYTQEQAEIQETLKRYDEIHVDPLFAMVVKSDNSKLDYLYTDEVLAQAKESIKLHMAQGRPDLIETLWSVYEQHIDKFLNNYKQAQQIINEEGNSFYLPIMDESTNMNIIESLNIKGGFVVEYIDWTGTSNETEPMKYSEAVKFVNTNVKKFVKVLAKTLKLVPSIYAVSGMAKKKKVKGVGSGFSERADIGGQVGGSDPRLPEVDEEIMQDLEETWDMMRKYYIEPFESRYVFNEDPPDFYTDKVFEDLRLALEEDAVYLSLKSILDPMRGDPPIKGEDLENMSIAIAGINEGSMQTLDTDTKKDWARFCNGYINLFQGVGRKPEKYMEMRRNVKAVVGSLLYDIGLNTFTQEELQKEKFMGRKLTYWKDKQEDSNIELERIIGLLVSRGFQKFIERIDDENLTSQYKRLKGTITRNNTLKITSITRAMLAAKDLLLKMQGNKVYKGTMDIHDVDNISFIIDLIQKENKIDLYATDIEKIVKHEGAFNTVATDMGLHEDIIYKVKGMFR